MSRHRFKSDRQFEILDYIYTREDEGGASTEVVEEDFSQTAIADAIRRGWIQKQRGQYITTSEGRLAWGRLLSGGM